MAKHYKGHMVNSSGSANMSADITADSTGCDIVELKHCQTEASFHVVISNTNAVGVVKFREKNKLEATGMEIEFNNGSTSYTVSSGTDVNQVFHIISFARYIEFFYDFTSGDGICDVYAKVVGD